MQPAKGDLAFAKTVVGKARAFRAVVKGIAPRSQGCIDTRREEFAVVTPSNARGIYRPNWRCYL